ncbi:uncharacterized protein TRAVEDRAFT_25186 [Trametes versicolor FP-101664 SS1]|uniref:uncharacterized protein n=1 Tax=Trametes versicolor (strain FP-101664) TaxID=717944 RepID=UPI00046237D3|nr:uncharacterized protein TRAVEDRAFT_25186 [Trametes versicolor FP-101664 SS1]EIW63716.1 hypothetical protein TRAVEDRAFT_25186 [Trametes versicolor FP-101664 SS1]
MFAQVARFPPLLCGSRCVHSFARSLVRSFLARPLVPSPPRPGAPARPRPAQDLSLEPTEWPLANGSHSRPARLPPPSL